MGDPPVITLPAPPDVVYDSNDYHTLQRAYDTAEEQAGKLYAEYGRLDRLADAASISTRDAKRKKAKQKYEEWHKVDSEERRLKFKRILVKQDYWARNHSDPRIRFKLSIMVANLYITDQTTMRRKIRTASNDGQRADAWLREYYGALMHPDEVNDAIDTFLFSDMDYVTAEHTGDAMMKWPAEVATFKRWKQEQQAVLDAIQPMTNVARLALNKAMGDIKYASDKHKFDGLLVEANKDRDWALGQERLKQESDKDKKANLDPFIRATVLDILKGVKGNKVNNDTLSTKVFAAYKEKWGDPSKEDVEAIKTVADDMLHKQVIVRWRTTRGGVSTSWFALAGNEPK